MAGASEKKAAKGGPAPAPAPIDGQSTFPKITLPNVATTSPKIADIAPLLLLSGVKYGVDQQKKSKMENVKGGPAQLPSIYGRRMSPELPKDKAESYITSPIVKIAISVAGDYIHQQMMSPKMEDVMDLCSYLAEKHQLKVTLKEAFKGAAVTGTCTIAGAVLGGPLGMAIGSAVGGISYAITRRGKFKSVPEILKTLTPQQKRDLCADIMKELGEKIWENRDDLIDLVVGKDPLKKMVIKKILHFIEKEVKSN